MLVVRLNPDEEAYLKYIAHRVARELDRWRQREVSVAECRARVDRLILRGIEILESADGSKHVSDPTPNRRTP